MSLLIQAMTFFLPGRNQKLTAGPDTLISSKSKKSATRPKQEVFGRIHQNRPVKIA